MNRNNIYLQKLSHILLFLKSIRLMFTSQSAECSKRNIKQLKHYVKQIFNRNLKNKDKLDLMFSVI